MPRFFRRPDPDYPPDNEQPVILPPSTPATAPIDPNRETTLDLIESPSRPSLWPGRPMPGSKAAEIAGCKCPTRSNWNGRGATAGNYGVKVAKPLEVRFWLVDRRCPVHKGRGEAVEV